MTYTYNVPRVTATLATLDNFNNPISYILDALNLLGSSMAVSQSKEVLLAYDQPVSLAVALGDLVYHNVDTGRFLPAIARLAALPGLQGQSVEAPLARVVGMVISTNQVTATILCGGIIKDGAAALACLGANAMPGTYFLSPWTAGKAVLNPQQNLRQPVLQYLGDGKISMGCYFLAHDGHQHASVHLTDTNWIYDDVTGVYTYDTSSDKDLQALGLLSYRTTALFVDGVLQPWLAVYSIDSTGRICATGISTAARHTVMNHYPLAYGAPVVRDVVTLSKRISIYNNAGIVHIQDNQYVYLHESNNAYAIRAILDNTLITTPVVSDITEGPGISVRKGQHGVVTVSSELISDTLIDAQLVNLNGAVHIEQLGITFTVLPAQRNTAFNMYSSINGIRTSASVYVWVQYTTLAATLLLCTIYFIPATFGSLVPIKLAGISAKLALPATSPGYAAMALASLPVSVSCSGYVYATISAANPMANVKLIRQGFIINPSEDKLGGI